MKNKVLHVLLAAVALLLAVGAEECLPRILGLGLPLTLATAMSFASRRALVFTIAFAAVAGLAEDSISSLPAMTSAGFFVPAALGVRRLKAAMYLACPLYVLWIALWLGGGSGVFGRLLVSFPLGALAALAADATLMWIEKKAAIDEEG